LSAVNIKTLQNRNSDIKIQLTDFDKNFARKIYSTYKSKIGSESIATEFAIAHLSALLTKFQPKNVIEFGAGIGTMTNVLLAHPSNIEDVTTTESNKFCLTQLRLNIPENLKGKLTVVENQAELLEIRKKCDLVIFDGGLVSKEELAFLGEGSICFIEGNRKPTAIKINAALASQQLVCDFDNHTQGYHFLHFTWKKSLKTNRKKLKVRFMHPKKGFRIGQVVPI